jgi:hypothetical protein
MSVQLLALAGFRNFKYMQVYNMYGLCYVINYGYSKFVQCLVVQSTEHTDKASESYKRFSVLLFIISKKQE